jgi:glycosyltransferase involved in cell wall biosynthesis
MRLLIHTQYYPPEIGAPQARLSELAKRFVERGHEVYVLTAMPNYPQGRIYPGYGGLFRREERDGVFIIRAYIYPTKSVGMVRRLANYFSFVFSSLLVGAVALPRMDFLITESPPLFLGISGYLLSRLKGARWIFNVSDLWPESAIRLGVVKEGWRVWMARALENFCNRKAWLVSGQSREILESIHRSFPDASTYHLSNGVDINRFSPVCRSEDVRREIANGKKCIAIYAGLHGVAQGLEQVLEAAARLQDLKDLSIVFVGDGPEKECLAERARRLSLTNVRFLDPHPHETMPAFLASADIALIPLKARLPGAVPSKLYEAMGSGLPIVMVAEGEGADILRRAKAGMVVHPGDVENLAIALRDLAQDRNKRLQLGTNGRRAVVAQFDRKAIADAFIDFLENHPRPFPSLRRGEGGG